MSGELLGEHDKRPPGRDHPDRHVQLVQDEHLRIKPVAEALEDSAGRADEERRVRTLGIRHIVLKGQPGKVVERLEAAYDGHLFSYSIVAECPLPLDNYHAVVTLEDAGIARVAQRPALKEIRGGFFERPFPRFVIAAERQRPLEVWVVEVMPRRRSGVFVVRAFAERVSGLV